MISANEFSEYLGKIKDTRLNIAISIVLGAITLGQNQKLLSLPDALFYSLQGILILSLIRLIHALIATIDTKIRESSNKKLAEDTEKEKARESKVAEKEKAELIRRSFYELDIFQLLVIQALRKQNHFKVDKGATLFSLQRMNIIYSVAIGEKTESVAFTKLAKTIVEDEIFGIIDELKEAAIKKFFDGLEKRDFEYFKQFENIDHVTSSKVVNHRTIYKDFYSTFYPLSNTILFIQPQRSNEYHIDPIAKKVIIEKLTYSAPTP